MPKTTFRPIFGKIVIKVEDPAEKRYGNIILPSRDRQYTTVGLVHAVYEAEETSEGTISPQVKVGDTVIFGQFTGTMITIDRETYIICKEHDLLSILDIDEDPATLLIHEAI